jgi:hypothetical protein
VIGATGNAVAIAVERDTDQIAECRGPALQRNVVIAVRERRAILRELECRKVSVEHP